MTMRDAIKRAACNAAVLAGVVFALPISCGQRSDGIYTGGIQPSPASRVNPAAPGFTNDGHQNR